jgi:serpin B
MNNAVRLFLPASLAMLLFACALGAQERPGDGWQALVRGNERFGRQLLVETHADAVDRNLVLSPVSLSVIFGALYGHSGSPQFDNEIESVFGFPRRNVVAPMRMLLSALREPPPIPLGQVLRGPAFEGAWLRNSLTCQGYGSLGDSFARSAAKDFGMEVKSTGARRPSPQNAGAEPSPAGKAPAMNPLNDMLVRSQTVLQTAWHLNTFSLSKPFRRTFTTPHGGMKDVEMLTSELKTYWYASTDDFEAAALPCNSAHMIVVLPRPGRTIADVARVLAAAPEALDAALAQRIGVVTLPPFHFRVEHSLQPVLERLGVRRPFMDLGHIVTIPRSYLSEVNQSVDIAVDKSGIRAGSDTIAGAIYGGIATAQETFHITLNRPFVFLIRDNTTNALLFIGALTDPTQE